MTKNKYTDGGRKISENEKQDTTDTNRLSMLAVGSKQMSAPDMINLNNDLSEDLSNSEIDS